MVLRDGQVASLMGQKAGHAIDACLWSGGNVKQPAAVSPMLNRRWGGTWFHNEDLRANALGKQEIKGTRFPAPATTHLQTLDEFLEEGVVARERLSSRGKGKGKGKGLPSSFQKPELSQAERDKIQEEKRSALARIEEAREREGRERACFARLPTMTSCALNNVPWETASMHVRVKGGREQGVSGVHVVEFGNGSAVCLRHVMITEIVADRVADAMNVRIANMRIVKPSDLEYEDISSMTSRLGRLSWSSRSKEPIMVLQFVPGFNLSCAQFKPSQELFHGLGRICALDVLLNNMDRVPLPLWDNFGNLTNVMINEEDCPVGIDQQVNPISNITGMESYIARVGRLVQLVVTALAADSSDDGRLAVQQIIAPFRRQLACCTCELEVSESVANCFVQGIAEGLGDAVQSWKTGSLERSLMDAERMAEHVCTQPGAMMEAHRHTDFVRRVMREVSLILQAS